MHMHLQKDAQSPLNKGENKFPIKIYQNNLIDLKYIIN
jgi:hypothetical protein